MYVDACINEYNNIVVRAKKKINDFFYDIKQDESILDAWLEKTF